MPSAPGPGRLILIDDDADLRGALRFRFEADGFEVLTFASGEELLATLPDGGSACIVIDQRLPGLSGLDTVLRLRAMGVQTPAILVTTHPSQFVIRSAAKASIDIVEKPLLGNALLQRVAALLGG
jgi:FixJ family two-component response regulator